MNINLPDDQKIPEGFFDWPLPIREVLYEAEQPIVFVTQTKQGQKMLAYLAGEQPGVQHHVLAPATDSSIQRLQTGSLGIREALTDTWMWLVTQDTRTQSAQVWSVVPSDLPNEHLPRPGTPLLPEHQIAFSARAIGDGIKLGSVPCSVVSFVADAVRASLKSLLDYVGDAKVEGRPTDAHRALYDLPVQQLKFASFEIGLAAPEADLFKNDQLEAAIARLTTGLNWALDDNEDSEVSSENPEELEAILRATLALTPPTSGQITSMEIGGEWLQGKKFFLDRTTRSKVRRRLKKVQSEQIFWLIGRIGEIDDDKFGFILRDVADGLEHRGSFAEELFDDMRSYYYEGRRVVLTGVRKSGKLEASAVAAAPAAEDSLALNQEPI